MTIQQDIFSLFCMTLRAKKTVRRFVLATFLLFAGALLFTAIFSSPAQAQSTTPLALKESQMAYKLNGHLFVLPDPGGKMLPKEVIQKYKQNRRYNGNTTDSIKLGTISSTPHWIIFRIKNNSWQESWLLSFGQHIDGRYGQLSQITLYNLTDKKIVLNTASSKQNPYISEKVKLTEVIPLTIPAGKEAVYMLHVIPEAGMPTTLPLQLFDFDIYMAQQKDILHPSRLVSLFLLLITGLFLGAALFKRTKSGLFFAVSYIFQLALFHAHNDSVLAQNTLSSETPGILLNLSMIAFLLGSKAFHRISATQNMQTKFFNIVVALLVLSTIVSLIVPDNNILRPTLIFAPALFSLIFLLLTAGAHSINGRPENYALTAGWFVLLCGAALSILTLTGLFSSTPLFTNAYWITLIAHSLFLLAAVTQQNTDSEDEDDKELKFSLSQSNISAKELRQTKEKKENARLLRMINHERELMNELRERELQQAKEMREAKETADMANRAKSAFLAVVSHEIRTPMSGITGMIRLLMESKLNKEQRKQVQTIQDSGNTMLALLNDILDFEKIETGKLDLEYIDFDLHRLITDVVTLMSGHAETKNISIKAVIDPAIPRFFIGDPVRMRQVLLNLAGNAIKFTEKGGVTIHVKPAHSKSSSKSSSTHRILFSVEDTGIGISPEAQKNLFNPFSQADSSITRKFGGSGLGLAISRRLIEAMGDDISIDSTEGKGSSFFFTLSLQEGSEEQAKTAMEMATSATPGKSEKSLHVLVVEDNEINRNLLKEFLHRMGHETTMAASGEEALTLVEEHPPFDMILMDVQLPGISGIGATKAIRAMDQKDKARIPVIALTGNVRDEDIRNCFAANMNDHISKPVDPQRLQKVIGHVIKGELVNPVEGDEDEGEEENENENEGKAKDTGTGDSGGIEKITDSGMVKTSRDKKEEEKPLQSQPIPSALLNTDRSFVEEYSGDNKPDEPPLGKEQVAPIQQYILGSPADFKDIEDDPDYDSFAEALEITEDDESTSETEHKPFPAQHDTTIDYDMLASLQSSIGNTALLSLLDDLFKKVDELIAALDKAIAEKDVGAIAARAHEFKGMTGNFGLFEASAFAKDLETAVKEENMEGLPLVLEKLRTSCAEAKNKLEQWISDVD